jgi:hypothetical protein
MPHKKSPDSGLAGRFQHAGYLGHNRCRILDLFQDPDLHIADDQRHPVRIADFFKGLGEI